MASGEALELVLHIAYVIALSLGFVGLLVFLRSVFRNPTHPYADAMEALHRIRLKKRPEPKEEDGRIISLASFLSRKDESDGTSPPGSTPPPR